MEGLRLPRNVAPCQEFSALRTERIPRPVGQLPDDQMTARNRWPDFAGIVGCAGKMALTLGGIADTPRTPERNSDRNRSWIAITYSGVRKSRKIPGSRLSPGECEFTLGPRL